MTPERWKQVKVILASALERPAEDHSGYLDRACDGDAGLRREVESLVAAMSTTGLETLDDALPRFRPGRQVGPYVLLAPQEGSAEVYCARDARLGHNVALKLLPDSVSANPEALERLRHDVHILASLRHSNIAAVHGLEESRGVTVLVAEMVEGETLAARLKREAFPLGEALALARDVALGIEAAHAAGIMHGNLSPENLKLTDEGVVKILNFGLAHVEERGWPTELLSSRPGRAVVREAAPGSMARDGGVDRRADIWAFGALLWEVIAARPPFPAVPGTVAEGSYTEPDWTKLPTRTPLAIRRLLKRCLERNPENRLHHIADARLDLEEALWALRETPVGIRSWSFDRRAVLVSTIAAALVGALATIAVRVATRRAPTAGPMRHLTILDAGFLPGYPGAISPDGRYVVFNKAIGTPGRQPLYVRSLDSPVARELPSTEGAANPFFSPDGRWVAFFQGRHLWRMELCGASQKSCDSSPQQVCEADPYATGTWTREGQIVISRSIVEGRHWPGLALVPDSGGLPRPLTSVDSRRGERFHSAPEMLPDGRSVLFTVTTRRGFRIESASLNGSDRRVVLENASAPRYAPSGHLIFYRQDTRSLLAVAFDTSRLEVRGSPVTVATDVMRGMKGDAAYALSREGTLVYNDTGSEALRWRGQVVWVARDGKVAPLLSEGGAWREPRLSPDSRRLLVRRVNAPNCDLWVYDLGRGTLTRLTTEGDNHHPAWSPDGRSVVFSVEQEGPAFTIHTRPTDGAGADRVLARGPESRLTPSWSRDEGNLVYTVDSPTTGLDIWVLAQGSAEKAFLATEFDESQPALSPDGRWIAYASDESGRSEVHVRSFPAGANRMQVSSNGGLNPLWSADGRELFFENDGWLMASSVTLQPALRIAAAQPLFGGDFAWGLERAFDVATGGDRFVIVKPDPVPKQELHVIVDWFDELRRRVPIR